MSYPKQPTFESTDAIPTNPAYSGLFYAIDQCDVNMCADIISKDPGAVKMKGWNDMTPLHSICLKGRMEIVKLFLDHGADIDARSAFDETPLHYACRRGDIRIMHMLLEARADWTAVDKLGRGCMHFAAMGGSVISMHYLVQQTRLTHNMVDSNGDSPLHISCQQRHTTVVDYLLRKSRSNPQQSNHKGATPVHLAARMGNTDLVWRMLRVAGCGVVRVKDGEGNTPIDIAKQDLTGRNKHMIAMLEYYVRQDPQSIPKGPVWTWRSLLLLPFIWSTSVFYISSCMSGYAGVFSIFMFVLLVVFVGRQSHRINHVAKWPNPIFLGAFAAGIIQCIIAARSIVIYLWPCNGMFISLSVLSTSCLYYLYYMTQGDPGVLTWDHHSVQLTVLDIALGRCKERDFCPITEVVKPDDSKYCRLCEKLVLNLDHHCLFVMNCVARNNHRAFVVFIANVMVMQVLFCVFTYKYMVNAYPNSFNWFVVDMFYYEGRLLDLMLLCVLAFIWECSLMVNQLYNIALGQTTYYQRQGQRPSYPTMLRNLVVFFIKPSNSRRSLKAKSPLLL